MKNKVFFSLLIALTMVFLLGCAKTVTLQLDGGSSTSVD